MPDRVFLIPRHKYPLLIEVLNPDRNVIWRERVHAPDGLEKVYIPPLAAILGFPVSVRLTYGDGSVEES